MFSHRLSENLKLVLAEPHLAEAIYGEADRSRASLSRWLPWAADNSLENTRTWIRLSQEQYAKGGGFQAVILEKEEVAGVVGYVYARSGRAELGYWLRDGFRGRGIMSRAVQAVAEDAHSRLKIHRLELLCEVENTASRAIPERLGIPLEGVMRGWTSRGDRRVDVALYSRLAGDGWGER